MKKSTEQGIYFINQPKMRDILQKTFPNWTNACERRVESGQR